MYPLLYGIIATINQTYPTNITNNNINIQLSQPTEIMHILTILAIETGGLLILLINSLFKIT